MLPFCFLTWVALYLLSACLCERFFYSASFITKRTWIYLPNGKQIYIGAVKFPIIDKNSSISLLLAVPRTKTQCLDQPVSGPGLQQGRWQTCLGRVHHSCGLRKCAVSSHRLCCTSLAINHMSVISARYSEKILLIKYWETLFHMLQNI